MRARRVVVAVPISIASHIVYEPMLPVDRSLMHQRMPLGAVFKIALVYDTPFWRADGLSGQSFACRSSDARYHFAVEPVTIIGQEGQCAAFLTSASHCDEFSPIPFAPDGHGRAFEHPKSVE